MQSIQIAFWILGLLGHIAFCVAFFNRLHAGNLPRSIGRLLEMLGLAIVAAGTVTWLWWGFTPLGTLPDVAKILSMPFPVAVYALLCSQLGTFAVASWVLRRLLYAIPKQLVSNHTEPIDVAERLGSRPVDGWKGRLLARIPGNQMCRLNVHEKTLGFARLPQELEGISIAHLSDLHFTGDLSRSYFEVIRDQTNAMDADLVAVTGDIIDSIHCLDWIPEVLGSLQHRHGAYFILGNHDSHVPRVEKVIERLLAAGLVDLGDRGMTIEARGCRILIAGNERPWFRRRLGETPTYSMPADFRILLSHSPDQINWAREQGFDLMLAGHTHGGQIRIPFVGPVVSPSSFGVKYASGTFYESPTLMHVTRGVSSQVPLRLNCPPELTKLILRQCDPE